ncbi:MAG: DUF4169 family protein [Deltaproteobacteria bacterium]|nr:DUF4169 family protein [Deltaproteobacteria bacterium]
MSKVINLGRFRKRKQREAEAKQADANALAHGRTKEDKELQQREREHQHAALEGAKREHPLDEDSIVQTLELDAPKLDGDDDPQSPADADDEHES